LCFDEDEFLMVSFRLGLSDPRRSLAMLEDIPMPDLDDGGDSDVGPEPDVEVISSTEVVDGLPDDVIADDDDFGDLDLSGPSKSGRFELGDFLWPTEVRSKSCFRFFDDPSFRSNFLLSSSDRLRRTSLFQLFEFESRFESGGLTSSGMISMPPWNRF
jgi:hypothetical protein